MSGAVIYRGLLWGWIALAAVVLVALLFVSAPYGRHARGGWGPTVQPRVGWLLMESPAVYVFALCLLLRGERALGAAAWVLVALWMTHYVHRALIYPFRLRGGAPMPLSVVAMALVFNLVNGYLQGRTVGQLGPALAEHWLVDPRFIGGVALFVGGLGLNLHSDAVLLRLRRTRERGYLVPHGGAFRWVSCPNYLGELIEWCGWAVAGWSLAGAAFAAWTAANLVPRALAHHRWYRQQFPDYPPRRRALIPFVL